MALPTARLAIFVASHVALSTVGFAIDRWYVWLVVWALQSLNFLTAVAIVHECTHSHWFGDRRADRITGTVLAGVGLTCFEAYRAQHILHHAHTCDEGDPEGEPYKFTARWQIAAAFLGGNLVYFLFVLAGGVAVAFGASPTWLGGGGQRRRIRINVLVFALAVLAVGALVITDLVSFRGVAFAWLIPAMAAFLGPIPFVLIPEHYDAPGPGPATMNTRTCTSNPVLRFLYLNTNFHTAHHDRPSIPWNELEAHHASIERRIEPEWLFDSYTSFHRFMWRTASRRPAHETVSASA